MWQPLHLAMLAGFAADDETKPVIKPRRAIVAGDVQPHGQSCARRFFLQIANQRRADATAAMLREQSNIGKANFVSRTNDDDSADRHVTAQNDAMLAAVALCRITLLQGETLNAQKLL